MFLNKYCQRAVVNSLISRAILPSYTAQAPQECMCTSCIVIKGSEGSQLLVLEHHLAQCTGPNSMVMRNLDIGCMTLERLVV